MSPPRLIHDRQISAGEHVRIWQVRDNRFLFERIMATGRGVTIVCNSMDEAMSLWQQVENGKLQIEVVPKPPGISQERKGL